MRVRWPISARAPKAKQRRRQARLQPAHLTLTDTTSPKLPTFLEIIEPDMAEVERRLRTIGEDDFPWLDDLLRYILATPGKRARPAVTLLAGRLFDFDPDVHISMAIAVELLHTASLVHDDSVDKASLRRGTATINARYGDEVALLLGDYLFASSAEMVCATNNVRVITLFSRTLRLLADGELREIQQAFDWTGGQEEYWARVERKTASLFTTAAVSGAVLGRRDGSRSRRRYRVRHDPRHRVSGGRRHP